MFDFGFDRVKVLTNSVDNMELTPIDGESGRRPSETCINFALDDGLTEEQREQARWRKVLGK